MPTLQTTYPCPENLKRLPARDLPCRQRSPWTVAEGLIAALFALAVVLSDGSRFLAGKAQMAFFDDDFFYYLQIARNLARGHGSSFDGIHLTNGYHPLWMLVLSAVCLLPQPAWLPLATVLVALSAWLCFLIGRRIFLLHPCDSVLATSAAGLLGLMAMFINRGGMEITLTLPLLFWLVYLRLSGRLEPGGGQIGNNLRIPRSPGHSFATGRVPAACTRLCPRNNAGGGWREPSPYLSARMRLLVGLLPIPLYLLINLHFFGTLMPLSGEAKQLEPHPAFAFGVIVNLFRYFPSAIRLVLLFPACALILLAVVKLPRLSLRLLPEHARPIVCCLLVFPVVHVLVLASLSDWPLWQWYLYSWIAGSLGALVVLLQPSPAGRTIASSQSTMPTILIRGSRVALPVLLIAVLCGYTAQRVRLAREKTGITFGIYDTAVRLASFSESHPGIYAMGDRAGIPGYVLGQPLIQLEGLVMDKPYLDHIRRQDDLKQVLDEYHVRYYVGSNLPLHDNCYVATEPAQGGSHSPKMQSRLCMQPVAFWKNAGGETEVFDLSETRGTN